ncbi:MAG: glycosyltransferase family 4 protein [Pseudomonadota bacterium]|nr:glycosyltransferase family 4 protein [Pseudomonadota bacterium]
MNPPVRSTTILQIIPRIDAGGAEQATLEITSAIARAGGLSLVVTGGGRLAPQIEAAGGEIVAMPAASKDPRQMWRNARALVDIIRTRGVEIVHARSRAPAWSALAAARLTGTPFVTTFHGAYSDRGPFKRLYNSIMARGDRVIANSHFTAALIHSRYPRSADRIRVIHRGVDLSAFQPDRIAPPRLAALRKKWGVAKDARLVLHAARLTGWKGQRTVIDAAAVLSGISAVRDAVVILAGDPQGRSGYVEELEGRIAMAGLKDRVRLVGHCDDMPAAYKLAHVAVVASTEPEAFGRASAEAQAMGCPVIVSDQGASPETIRPAGQVPEEEMTGWVVPVGDVPALAGALCDALCLSNRLRERMGRAARAYVTSRFTDDAMKQATLAVYDELLGSALRQAYLDAGEPPRASAGSGGAKPPASPVEKPSSAPRGGRKSRSRKGKAPSQPA